MTASRFRCLTAAFAAALFLAALSANAQGWTGKGRLHGEILDQNGKPVAGAKVTLTKDDIKDSAPEPVLTDAKGKWKFAGLATGAWTVVIDKEGYVGSEGKLQVNEYQAAPVLRIKISEITEEMRRAAAPQPNPATAFIEAGNAFLVAGKCPEARAEYEKAMATLDEENKVNVRRGIARCFVMEKNSDAALGIVNELLALNPADVDSLKIKAQAQYEAKNLEDSIATLKGALAVAPADVDMLNLISSLLVEVGRETEAREWMAKMPAGTKVDPVSLLNIGIRHYNQGKMEEALKTFQEVIAQSPEVADGYYYRGLAYLGSGKTAEAKADFQKFLALDPKHARAEDAKMFLKEM